MSLPGSPDTGVGISSIFSLFPPAKSPSGSTSLSNGELPVPNFSPSISSFFPPNNSPSSSESAPVKQSSPSISLLFPPTHSQSNSLSSTGTIHELANTICSIFRPNCSYSSSSESSHDQVTSKIKILDHEMEDVTSSYIEGLDQLRSGLLQQQKPFLQAPQPFTPQHQQLPLLAMQNLTSPSATEEECVDEEELLNMPNLLVEMAEGMLLGPHWIQSKSSSDEPGGDGNGDGDGLWSYAY